MSQVPVFRMRITNIFLFLLSIVWKAKTGELQNNFPNLVVVVVVAVVVQEALILQINPFRRIPVAVPDPAMIKAKQSSRCWSSISDFIKSTFCWKFLLKSNFAKPQKHCGIAVQCIAMPCFADIQPHTKRAPLRKMFHTNNATEIVLQCCLLY